LKCLADLPRTRFHHIADNDVARIFWGRIPVVQATSFIYFSKESRYRQIIHDLKYKNQQHIGIKMGRLFALELRNTGFMNTDYIIPVPLHAKKLRIRGYNQSRLIAEGMSEIMHKPVLTDHVIRKIPTKTQTRKSRYERWENVRDTFYVMQTSEIQNKHFLLVDDVITTGSTIEACARALLEVPGVSISIASLACVKIQ
jgi:ComF family protein